jgi:hypothetical protein
VTLHTPSTPDVTVMAAIFSYYSATFEMSRYSVDRMWEDDGSRSCGFSFELHPSARTRYDGEPPVCE